MSLDAELEDDSNYQASKKMETTGELMQYAGQYVAFSEGEIILSNSDKNKFFADLISNYPRAGVYYCVVDEEGKIKEKVVHIRSPRLVRKK